MPAVGKSLHNSAVFPSFDQTSIRVSKFNIFSKLFFPWCVYLWLTACCGGRRTTVDDRPLPLLRCLQTNGTKGCPKCFKSSMKPGFVWPHAPPVGSAATATAPGDDSSPDRPSLDKWAAGSGLRRPLFTAPPGGEALNCNPRVTTPERLWRTWWRCPPPSQTDTGWSHSSLWRWPVTGKCYIFIISWRRKKQHCLWVVSERTGCLWMWLVFSYTLYLLLISCTYCSLVLMSSARLNLSELSYTFLSAHQLECLYKTGTSNCYKHAVLFFVFLILLWLRSPSQRTLC